MRASYPPHTAPKMTDLSNVSSRPDLARFAPSLSSPTGLQANAELSRRRQIVIALNVTTYLAMLWGAATVLGAGGWTLVDAIMLVCFMIGTPWTVLGFWNAVIGLWLLHFHEDAMTEVAPFAAAGTKIR